MASRSVMRGWLARWRALRAQAAQVLSMNNRNLGYVYPHNARRHFPIANDKLLCKQTLEPVGVPVPRTHFTYRYFFELARLAEELGSLQEFVIKPANGSAGHGILVIVAREGEQWVGVNGRRYGIDELRRHISDIIFGVYSFDAQDCAIVEDRVLQHPELDALCDRGLADVRVILYRDRPVLAMSRVPTLRSDGKANLHQGAVGLGIDIDSGRTVHAVLEGRPVTHHPDSNAPLIGITLPFWESIMAHSRRAAAAVPLKYLGVDVAISRDGPVVLEINARPGLEIQNANLVPLRTLLERVDG